MMNQIIISVRSCLLFIIIFNSKGVPVLVLANKQDLPGALDPKEIEKLLGLHELTFATPSVPSNCTGASSSSSSTQLSQTQPQSSSQSQFKLYHVQSSCAVTGEGLHEGLEVLYEMITKKRKLSKTSRKKR